MDQLVRQRYRLSSSDPVRLQQQRPAKQFQVEEPVDNNVNFKSTHASNNNNLIDSSPQDRLVSDDEDVDTNNLVVESSASSMTNDVNNIERLTVLEAPSVAIDSRSSLSRASSLNNNISNRETNLLSSASPATGTQSTPNIQYPPSQQRPNDNTNIYNTDILAAGQRNQTSPDESSHPTTFLGFSTILIIILGLIILYNWLLQRRKGGGRQKWTIVDFWPISLLPSEYILSKGNLKFRYNSNKQTVSKRATSKDNELDRMATLCSRGEHVQLVNRRPLGACEGQSRTDDIAEEPEEEDTEAIQVIQEIDDQPATEKSQGPFGKLNDKFVIFKHRLAKSSLVVAVETSGRPKVRLITAKLRKFIDEEADELRWKRENQNQSQIWYQKALFHLFDWLSSESKPTSEPECEQETESKFEQVRDCPQSSQNQVNTEHEKTKSNLQPKARLERTLAATNKLSPSPIFPDGCSSLSGCSLLSPSPTIEQHQAPICNCPLMAGPKWDAGFGLVQSTARSRSQGHSPCQLGALNQLNEPFRPCCSASPSVFKAQPQRQVCNQLFQQQQQQVPTRHQQMMQHRCDLIARKPSFERPTTTTCDASRNQYSTLAKCGAHNHIKRQYENYYDEERGDAYCRLTASFGMDAQEACGRDPAAADASLLSLEYSTCNSGQPGLAHCNGLPANHAMGGQCDRVSSMGAFQMQLATNPNSEPLCKCCHRPEPNQGFYGQQVVPPPFDQQCQFKWASSVSEPQSSASTSLGGSDSGFVVSNAGSNLIYQPPAVCRDPSCACQPQTACPSMPVPPMSILVQQPSIATPPPPPAARESPSVEPVNGDSEKSNKPDEKANEPAKREATKQMEKPAKRCPPPLGPAAVRKSCSASGRPRWKHRRRLSQRRRTDLTPPSAPLCRPTGVQADLDGSRQASYQSRGPPPPRRMSIAGDQVYPSRAVLARDSLSSGSCRPAPSTALMHRASIAGPDGAWSQSPLWYGGRSGPRGQQQPGSHFGSPAHRPSDASLYEGILLAGSQCCSASSSTASVLNGGQLTMAGGKIAACSAYSSSSGGSSSGIGITGSACTNTPTSTHLPYGGSFASAQENDGCPPDVQPMCPGGYHRHHQSGRHHHYHQHAAHYAHMAVHHGAQLTGDSICQAPACPSRKYSLPVQLEASAATCSPNALERLSPNQQLIGQTRESQRPSRFLFEKNLQRVDSIGTPIGEVPGSASSRHQQPFGDSRRSSQTVTRQSSFWLEDNSLDMSIISSLATSGLGDAPVSDEEPTNNCLPGAEQSQGIYGQPAESHNQQPAVSSQRPSISSLILSADSIESVKQRPPVEPKGPSDEANQAPGVQESSSSSFENHSARPDTLSSNLPANKGLPSTKGCTTRVGRCNRLSSSSTSSSTSSPSPDFSRPSERILALAPNSSSISKRHLFGRLRSRSTRYLRPGSHQDRRPPALSAIVHQHSAPDATSSMSESAGCNGHNGEPDEAEEAAKSDGCPTTPLLDSGSAHLASKSGEVNVIFESNASSERPIVDLNSTSLERQCRELWKLRAALHEDSCVGQDDWSNYHQRLNRRYDSGYKSIENQLSSSLENNHQSAPMNVAAAAAAAAATQGLPRDSSSQARPPSGCSGVRPQSCEPERGKIYRRPSSADAVAQIKLELAKTGQPFSLDLDGQPVDHVSSAGKLVELDTRLDSASNGDLMLLGASSNEALDRESCQSRSSNGEPNSSNQDLGSPPPNTRGHETT